MLQQLSINQEHRGKSTTEYQYFQQLRQAEEKTLTNKAETEVKIPSLKILCSVEELEEEIPRQFQLKKEQTVKNQLPL